MEYGKLQTAERRAERQEVNLTGIPAQMKWDLEARSGLSLDDVRVHYHSDKPAGLGALAYTQGTQVHIGPGQEGHLRHELGHVVQQKLGLVRPNARIPGGPALNTEEALERQADLIGAGQTVLSAVPPVQRCEAPVVQAAGHITLIPGADSGVDEVELPAAESPTIVFEAMGVKVSECEAVYKQTKRYPGNTICVFGLNAKPEVTNADFDRTRAALSAYADRYDPGDDGYSHLLYTFSFRWTKLEGDTRGYEMPFVEARVLVMQKAADIVKNLTGGAAAPDMPTQYTFLYRWIDADAGDDTTDSLPHDQLNRLAKSGSAEVMTGRYDWRSLDVAGSRENYEAFLNEFNQAEKELRDYYMLLHDPGALSLYIRSLRKGADYGESEPQEGRRLVKVYKDISAYGAEMAPLAEIKSNRYLPGYYFPESALMMNQAAHESIVEAFRWVGDSPDRVLSKIGVPVNDAQDKESMRLVSLLGAPRINYEPEFSVTKPLKNEFAARTYWGAEMHGFLSEQRRLVDGDEARFNVALRNVRQSAFDPDHWYFISNATWNQWGVPRMPADTDITETRQELFNQKRRELATRLFKYLAKEIIVDEGTNRKKTMRQLIAGEIPPPPASS